MSVMLSEGLDIKCAVKFQFMHWKASIFLELFSDMPAMKQFSLFFF